jgi:hypothetical protein
MTTPRPWLLVCAVCGLFTSLIASAAEQTPADASQLIDQHVAAQLKAAGITPSPLADDAEFLRRVHLDLHGVVPTAERVKAFLADQSAGKRAKVIDDLLADPRFAAHLADQWDDYLIPMTDDPRASRAKLRAWLEEAFHTKSWDRVAQELVTATGNREKNGAVAYLLKGRETLTPPEVTDLFSQYFLGMRMNCAQCHDHPFTSWKQTDYWGLASFFTQIQYTDRRQQKSQTISDDLKINIDKLEEAARLRAPRFLGGDALELQPDMPHRQALAKWLTAPDNPYFARAMVNRMWANCFGRGIVEPFDDMHPANKATHPELLAELSLRFANSGFDLRFLARTICNSEAYQRTSIPTAGNERDATLYSHMTIKLLTPEQLYDSLAVVLPPTRDRKGGGGSADPREEFVTFFRADGEVTSYNRGIPQLLRMMNSPERISPRSESATVRNIVVGASSEEQAIEALVLHMLARKPTAEEQKIFGEFVKQHPGTRDEAYAEVLWSLLNCSEFTLNH